MAARSERDHHPAAISARLEAQRRHSYLGDAVLGGIDGCVTTFTVVAGALGAGRRIGAPDVRGTVHGVADGHGGTRRH